MLSIKLVKKLSHFTIDINLKVGNEILILFGPSGSGKTTILNCIAGLEKPDYGQIILNNKCLYKTNMHSIPVQKRRIGYLFQDYALFPHMTVEKNILYGNSNKSLSYKLAQALGIEHLFKKYPQQISGGEKQRVALTRTLSTEPKTLLLDEPFSSLDKQTKIECYDELLRLQKLWKIPIILVTHDFEEAKRLGNRILYMKEGKLFECKEATQSS